MADYSLKVLSQMMKKPLLQGAFLNKNFKSADALVLLDFEINLSGLKENLLGLVQDWQLESLSDNKTIQRLDSQLGPIYVVLPLASSESCGDQPTSRRGWIKKAMGQLVFSLEKSREKKIQVQMRNLGKLDVKSVSLGIEVASYSFKNTIAGKNSDLQWSFVKDRGKLNEAHFQQGLLIGQSVNLCRHAVNTPANYLNPKTFGDLLVKEFTQKSGVKVELWSESRLKKENMNLMLAVGRGANEGPRLVHIQYRPRGASQKKPQVFVGKGICYDTGGLSLKPTYGMRNMKKDMGGSAALLGVLHWAVQSKIKKPLDFYFAIAENSIDEDSYRPGDVITSRNGLTVEIHNTDAEGRLVLADALDVASEQKQKPASIINVATLTGAMKVALGSDLAGLFSNNEKLKDKLMKAAYESHDLAWPMPLYEPYYQRLNSNVADMVNSSDGLAGGITAALFLKKFVGDLPFAHLDIFAWTEGSKNALRETGANGQSVEMLTEFLDS